MKHLISLLGVLLVLPLALSPAPAKAGEEINTLEEERSPL